MKLLLSKLRLLPLVIALLPTLLQAQSTNPNSDPFKQSKAALTGALCGLPGMGPVCAAPGIANCLISQTPIQCLGGSGPSCAALTDPAQKKLCEDAAGWAKDINSCVSGGGTLPACMDLTCRAAPPPFGGMCGAANSGSQMLAACLKGLIAHIDEFYECSVKAGSDPQVCKACSNQAGANVRQSKFAGAFNSCDPAFRQSFADACNAECTSQVMQSNRTDCRAAGQTGGTVTGQLERCCRSCISDCMAELPPCVRNPPGKKKPLIQHQTQ